MVCLRNIKEVSVFGVERMRGRVVGDEEIGGGKSVYYIIFYGLL